MVCTAFATHRVSIVLLAIFSVVVFGAQVAVAKRGCSNFGHSCYGGMGKRDSNNVADGTEEVFQNPGLNSNDEGLIFTGPRSFQPKYVPSQHQLKISPEEYENIARYFKEWLMNNRKERQNGMFYN